MKTRGSGGNNGQGSKWIRRERRLAIYHRDDFECVYCARKDRLTLDHVRARLREGANRSENLVTACAWCNTSRGARPIRTWLRSLGIDPTPIVARVRRVTRRRVDIDVGRALVSLQAPSVAPC